MVLLRRKVRNSENQSSNRFIIKRKNRAESATIITLYIIGYDSVNLFSSFAQKETAVCFGLNRVIGPYLL